MNFEQLASNSLTADTELRRLQVVAVQVGAFAGHLVYRLSQAESALAEKRGAL